MRPWASVSGTRWTRWPPDSNLSFEYAPAHDSDDHFLVPADLGRALGDHFRGPAVALGKAHVHPQQVAGEQTGLVTAGACTDLEKDVAVIVRVLGQQQPLQVGFQRFDASARGVYLLLGKRLHVRVGQHLLGPGEVGMRAQELVEPGNHRLELCTLASQRPETVHVARGILAGQLTVDLLEPSCELLELRFH
jgi:hypothetical protein